MLKKIKYISIIFLRSKATKNGFMNKPQIDLILDFSLFPEQRKAEFCTGLASVTNILSKTIPPLSLVILKRWKNKMISALGEKEFELYMQEIKSEGTRAHGKFEEILISRSFPEYISDDIKGYLISGKGFLEAAQEYKNQSKYVFHVDLGYKGIVDNFIQFNNQIEILEIKTKTENKRICDISSTYDDTLQLAAYIGAYNLMHSKEKTFISHGRLIYLYKDGYPATDIGISGSNLERAWNAWKERLLSFYT